MLEMSLTEIPGFFLTDEEGDTMKSIIKNVYPKGDKIVLEFYYNSTSDYFDSHVLTHSEALSLYDKLYLAIRGSNSERTASSATDND